MTGQRNQPDKFGNKGRNFSRLQAQKPKKNVAKPIFWSSMTITYVYDIVLCIMFMYIIVKIAILHDWYIDFWFFKNELIQP